MGRTEPILSDDEPSQSVRAQLVYEALKEHHQLLEAFAHIYVS